MNNKGHTNTILSRKSLSKLNQTYQTNENVSPCQQQAQLASSSSLSTRKASQSWLAQSFRKAFGKIENRRKTSQLNKSQSQLNKSLKAMSSTFSVNTNAVDYEFLSTESSQRNSSSSAKTTGSESGGSKRSSLSDDEAAQPSTAYVHSQHHHHHHHRPASVKTPYASNKLSLAPMTLDICETELYDDCQNGEAKQVWKLKHCLLTLTWIKLREEIWLCNTQISPSTKIRNQTKT